MILQVTEEQLQKVVAGIAQSFLDRIKDVPPPTDEQMLSAKDVAALLSVSLDTVREYTKQGYLISYRLGGSRSQSVRYKRSEVLRAWTQNHYGR